VDEKTLTRFFAKVDKNGPVLVPELGPCHIWTGCRMANGYGMFRITGPGGRVQLAHRVAWRIAKGAWPPKCALHKCDGGSLGCVRPDHLFDGTKADNNRDRHRKGRSSPPVIRCVEIRGAKHPNTHLSDDDVRAIRARRAADETLTSIAARFHVSFQTVSDIARRKVWRFLD
jgi:HNH endonuclease